MSEENIGNGLEVAVWEALEDAGCDPSTYEGIIGVYAGGTSNRWWEVLTIISGKTGVVGRGSEGRLIMLKKGVDSRWNRSWSG